MLFSFTVEKRSLDTKVYMIIEILAESNGSRNLGHGIKTTITRLYLHFKRLVLSANVLPQNYRILPYVREH